MLTNILSNNFYRDPIAQDLQSHLDKCNDLSDSVLYYNFPIVQDSEQKSTYPSFILISKLHGIILIKCDDIEHERDEYSIQNILDSVSRIEDLLYANFIKNPSKNIKKDRRVLSFDLSSLIYVPRFEGKIEDENRVMTSHSDVDNYLDDHKSSFLSTELFDEIISILDASTAIIKPKERIVAVDDTRSKAYLLKLAESEIARLDSRQKYAALSQIDGPQRVRGLAGSGKTIILCLKAALIHFKNPNARILYTFSTRSLYDYIELLITRFYKTIGDGQIPDFENSIHIRHSWGGVNLKGVYYDACINNQVIPLTLTQSLRFSSSDDAFDYVCTQLLESKNGELRKAYDYVLLDEAQDFKPSFYHICRQLVENDCLVWAYDELQNIYDVKIQNTISLFSNKYGHSGIDLSKLQSNYPYINNDIVLNKCYRSSREILVLAHSVGFGIYNDKLIQSLENNSHWEDFGYKVNVGNCSNGDFMEIERPEENCPLSISKLPIYNDSFLFYSSGDIIDEVKWVCNSIEKAIVEDKLRPDDIMVISLDDRNAKRYFDLISSDLISRTILSHNLSSNRYEKGFLSDGCITLTTVYKAKGNEAALVYVIGCDVFEYNRNSIVMRNKVFTAFTRAKAWLRISGIKIEGKSLVNEINTLIANDYKLKFTHKESRIIKRDLAENNEKRNNLRREYEKIIVELVRKGYSEDEIGEMLKSDKDILKEDE